MDKLAGKTALVTGGTSGIGAECARMFARHGANVILTGTNEARGKAVEIGIRSQGKKAHFFPCDVSDELQVKRLIETCVKTCGGIDILMNNAGVMPTSTEIDEIPLEEWERDFVVCYGI